MTSEQSSTGRALVASLSDLSADPRVARQIEALDADWTLVTAGFARSHREEIDHIPLSPSARQTTRGLVARLAAGSRAGPRALSGRDVQVPNRWFHAMELNDPRVIAWEEALNGVQVDVAVVNDPALLGPAHRALSGVPVVFDAHEYAPGQYASWRWRLTARPYTKYLLTRYVPELAGMSTVSDGIANLYQRDLGVRPVVVSNATRLYDLQPTPVSEPIRLVYWGSAHPQRGIEVMIDAVRSLTQRFTFDLYLVGLPRWMDALRERSAGDARIRFRAPVAMQRLPEVGNSYDVGIYMLPPSSDNQLYALPNKLFEFLQARLALVVGPSPEMARLVQATGTGVVAEGFDARAFSRAFDRLDRDAVSRFKARAHKAAATYNAEANHATLRRLIGTAACEGSASLSSRPRAGPA